MNSNKTMNQLKAFTSRLRKAATSMFNRTQESKLVERTEPVARQAAPLDPEIAAMIEMSNRINDEHEQWLEDHRRQREEREQIARGLIDR